MRLLLLLLFFSFSINQAKALNFKNFYELSGCVDYYNTFKQYKQNLTKCLKNQNIVLEEENLKLLNNKSGIIENIIELDLPKEEIAKSKKGKKKFSDIIKEIFSEENIEKIAEEENIFNKPSALSENYNIQFSLNETNFKELNNYIKKNPQDIYSITEDINILTYKNQYLSEFKRNEILLNVYNSFNPNLLIPKANIASAKSKITNVSAAATSPGLGAIAGPIICSILMNFLGPNGFFVHLLIFFIVITCFGIFRMNKRKHEDNPDSTFTPLPKDITPLGIELDPDTGVDLSNTTTNDKK